MRKFNHRRNPRDNTGVNEMDKGILDVPTFVNKLIILCSKMALVQ